MTKEETEAREVKRLVPKHTNQLVAKRQPEPRVCSLEHHAISRLWIPSPDPRPRAGQPPRGPGQPACRQGQTTKKGALLHRSQHFTQSFSNVLSQPHIEMPLKGYVQIQGEIHIQAIRGG